MKIFKSDIDERIKVSLNKTFKDDVSSGIMSYGAKNDYPDVIETLILGSQTGKATSETYAKYIAGDGFNNPNIGKVVVGIDSKGKKVTLDKIRRQIAQQISFFNGVYLHLDMNAEMFITSSKILPFKQVRLSRADDSGYSSRVAYTQNWTTKLKKESIEWFNIYTGNKQSYLKQLEAIPGGQVFKGQVYLSYVDESFIYPLSPFDSVYLDLDTEYQIQLYKNREIRNGFNKKIVMNVDLETSGDIENSEAEEQARQFANDVNSFMGPEGDKVLIIGSKFDENGNLLDKSYKIEQIETTIDKDIFQNTFTQDTANSIRKSAKSLPALLIDYENNKLSGTSGEAIVQANNFYNAVTRGTREHVQEIIQEIFSNFDNDTLRTNQDWTIKEVNIYDTNLGKTTNDKTTV